MPSFDQWDPSTVRGGPRDVTTPPDQSTDLAPVLASDRGDERICAPKPSSEGERVSRRRLLPSGEGGDNCRHARRREKVSELVLGLVFVVLVVGRSVGVRGSRCGGHVFGRPPAPRCSGLLGAPWWSPVFAPGLLHGAWCEADCVGSGPSTWFAKELTGPSTT